MSLKRIRGYAKLALAARWSYTEICTNLPNVGENVLRQSGLQEDVLDLHPRDEAVPVRVRLPEQRLEAQLLPRIHHPRDRLHARTRALLRLKMCLDGSQVLCNWSLSTK